MYISVRYFTSLVPRPISKQWYVGKIFSFVPRPIRKISRDFSIGPGYEAKDFTYTSLFFLPLWRGINDQGVTLTVLGCQQFTWFLAGCYLAFIFKVGKPWIANQVDSDSSLHNKVGWSRWWYWLVHVLHGGNQNQQGYVCPFDVASTLCSGLVAPCMWLGWTLEKSPNTYRPNNYEENFSSLLNTMIEHLFAYI